MKAINRNQRSAVAFVLVAVLVTRYVVYSQIRAASSQGLGALYFSDDDGKTWYAESAGTISPATHEGKEAYRAHVFTCDGKAFVGYLEEFSPNAKTVLDQATADAKAGRPVDRNKIQGVIMGGGLLIKKPGDKEWKSAMGPEASLYRSPQCPDKTPANEVR